MTRPDICHRCSNPLTDDEQSKRRDDTGNNWCDTCWDWKSSHRFVLWRRPPWEDDTHTGHRGGARGERDHHRGTNKRRERVRAQLIAAGVVVAIVAFFGLAELLGNDPAPEVPYDRDGEFTVEDCHDLPYDPDYPDAESACIEAMAGR